MFNKVIPAISSSLIFLLFASSVAAQEESYTLNYNETGDTVVGCTNCTGKAITIPAVNNGTAVTTIGENAFIRKQLTSVKIPNSVKLIEKQAFLRNSLKVVSIPNSVTRIGEFAFAINSLTSLTISENLRTIDSGTFRDNQLESVIIPESVTTIGSQSFEDNKLKSVTVPSNVKLIESLAFASNSITSALFKGDRPYTSSSAFFNNPLKTLNYLPSTTGWAGTSIDGVMAVPLPKIIGYLENPVKNQIDSGVSVVSGWHCTANKIEIRIDGKSYGLAGSGTQRPDTKKVCGHTDTGFSLLFNYGELSEGDHTVAMYADGELFAQHTFNSVKSGGDNFVKGLSKTIKIPAFPNAESEATLSWSTAKQSFSVTEVKKGVYSKSSVIERFNTVAGNHGASGEDVREEFYGATFGFTVDGNVENQLASSNVTFKFNIDDSTFRLTRTDETGSCIYRGTYSVIGDMINTAGKYQCGSFQAGTYSAKGLKVDANGVYTGKFLMMREDGQVIKDIHTGV